MALSPSKGERSRPGMFSEGGQLGNMPWWALILLATGLILAYLILANPFYKDTFIFLVEGIKVTLRMTFIAFGISLVLGLLIGLGRTSKNKVIYTLATLYVEAARGIPLIVLMLYVAFVLVPAGIQAINAIGTWGLGRFCSRYPAKPFSLDSQISASARSTWNSGRSSRSRSGTGHLRRKFFGLGFSRSDADRWRQLARSA